MIYIIENNRYAMGTAITRSSATTDLSKRGLSFNIPGEQVDGMDVRAVKAAGEKAVHWCREGKGPYILEMLTYRYRGHSMSDPAKYRTREEVQKMRTEHDPIEQVRVRILEKKLASEDDLKKIDAEVRDIVNEAAEFATNDPEPDAAELWTDVYALMQSVATVLAYLAFAGAVASWIAGAVFFVRTLARDLGRPAADVARDRRLAVRDLAASGARAPADAANVNKALVAFIACMLVGVAAFRGLGQSPSFREVEIDQCRSKY